MNQNELMQKIMEYGFAIIDLGLYLDTHPQDQEALSTYSSLKEHCHSLSVEYSRRFGPLNFKQVTSDNYWTWISTPWPWEGVC